jgi:hypothetical protein
MNRLVVPSVIIIAAAAGGVAWSQTPAPAPNPTVTVYYTTPLENDPLRFVRLQSVTFPAGQGNNSTVIPAINGRSA